MLLDLYLYRAMLSILKEHTLVGTAHSSRHHSFVQASKYQEHFSETMAKLEIMDREGISPIGGHQALTDVKDQSLDLALEDRSSVAMMRDC